MYVSRVILSEYKLSRYFNICNIVYAGSLKSLYAALLSLLTTCSNPEKSLKRLHVPLVAC